MSNLYPKVAVAFACTALSFALGASQEVKAATFSLTGHGFLVVDYNQDELGDWATSSGLLPVGIIEGLTYGTYGEYYRNEYRAFYEFNIASLSLPSDAVISSAILQVSVKHVEWYGSYFGLEVYGHGYQVNEGADIVSIFNAGEYLDGKSLYSIITGESAGVANFNVLPFINQRTKNNEVFAGFGIRYSENLPTSKDEGYIYLTKDARLIVETEPVPEPTTIFGSAIGLCLGGWLKRKKSPLQKKAKSQA